MSPSSLAVSLAAAQKSAPDPGRPFRYCELGCGVGGTLTALAALSPQSEFCGIDYIPLHVATARRTAEAVELDNLSFEVGDFMAMVGEAPPGGRFDFIALHGVWSWVSREGRQALVRLLDAWLEPGGIVFLSYNARPAWNDLEPLRYVLRELLGNTGSSVDREALNKTMDRWTETQSSAIHSFWKRLRPLPTSYLIHDFGAREATAHWPMDVADRLAKIGLDFAGHAELLRNFPKLALSETARDDLKAYEAAGMPRTGLDMVMACPFREDLFTRGAPSISNRAILRNFTDWHVHAAYKRPSRTTSEDAPMLAPKLTEAIERIEAQAPLRLSEAIDLLDGSYATRLQILFFAKAIGRVTLSRSVSSEAKAAITRFNSYARVRFDDGEAIPGLICAARGEIVPLQSSDVRHLASVEKAQADRAAWLGQYTFAGFDTSLDEK